MAYLNRMCELLNGGSHIAPAAVLYHAEAEWTGKYMTSDQVGRVLADHQIEYDYLPQAVFIVREYFKTEISEGILKVNTQKYKVLLIPYMQYMTEQLAKAVIEMSNNGVHIILIDDYPEAICKISQEGNDHLSGFGSQIRRSCPAVGLDSLADEMKKLQIPEITLSPADDRIRYLHYIQDDGTDVWMFVNEGERTYHGKVSFHHDSEENDRKIYRYDAWDNQIFPVDLKEKELLVSIEPLKSRVYIIDDTAENAELDRLYGKENIILVEREQIPFMDTWKRSICKSIDYPDFDGLKEVNLPDNLAEEMPEFSGYVRYENRFEADKSLKVYLEITDAAEGVEVFLNGVSLGIQIVPEFVYDLSENMRQGINEIAIEVATTLERENTGIPDVTGKVKEAESKSGITGQAVVWRDKTC